MSPFQYGCTVSDEFFCPRPNLERRLAEHIKSGQHVAVVAGAKNFFFYPLARRGGFAKLLREPLEGFYSTREAQPMRSGGFS